VSTACNQVRRAINVQQERSEITLLPSTALAIGYHENFIRKVVSVLIENRRKPAPESGIRKIVKQRLPDGSEQQEMIPLTYEDFVLRVFIPTGDLSELAPDGLKSKVQNLIQISLRTPFRDFPFYIRADEKDIQQTSVLQLFDIPTTLLASREAIKWILKQSFLGRNRERDKLEKREALNFHKTLAYLIDDTYGNNPPYLQLEQIPTLASLP
jgi:hypothetical protein